MKKIITLSIICLISVVCTGCVQYSYEININKKDDVNITEIQGINTERIRSNELLEMVKNDNKNFIAQKQRDNKLINYYDNNNIIGFIKNYKTTRLTAAYKNLPIGFVANANSFQRTRNLIKKTYKIHLTYNSERVLDSVPYTYNQLKEESTIFKTYKIKTPILYYTTQKFGDKDYLVQKDATGNTMISSEKSNNTIQKTSKGQLVISIPTVAKKHNATKVLSNNKYMWDLSNSTEPVEIYLEYEVNEYSSLAFIFSLLLIICGAFKLSNMASKKPPVQGL